MAHLSFQQEYMQIPVVTRTYTTACLLTTIAVVSSLSQNVTDSSLKKVLVNLDGLTNLEGGKWVQLG